MSLEVAADPSEDAHQASSAKNGFDARSRPTVVREPCPGSTSSASSSVRNHSRLARIAGGEEFGKSERPMEPAKTRSPAITVASVSKQQ